MAWFADEDEGALERGRNSDGGNTMARGNGRGLGCMRADSSLPPSSQRRCTSQLQRDEFAPVSPQKPGAESHTTAISATLFIRRAWAADFSGWLQRATIEMIP